MPIVSLKDTITIAISVKDRHVSAKWYGEMLGFETLTHCPIDRRLVQADMLSRRELDWLNDYHAQVRLLLIPLPVL